MLGIDDAGREILTYVKGVTIWPDAPHALVSDDALATAAGVVGDFHRAAASFSGGQALHGDLGTWNVVVGPAGFTLIDWDDVELGEVAWEVAYVLHSFLVPESCAHIAGAIRRHAAEGRPAALRMLATGDDEVWAADAAHTAVRLPAWLAAIAP